MANLIGKTVLVIKPGIMNGLEGEVQSMDQQKEKAVINFGQLGTWSIKVTEIELIKSQTTKKAK